MSRTIHKLTPERVRRYAKRPGLHGDGGGLYLRVTPPSACSWVFRYMLKGRAREMGLGSYPELSLEHARIAVRESRERKARGEDPIAAREAERASARLLAARSITFGQCVESYIAAHADGWIHPKHAKQWAASLNSYAAPLLGDLPVSEIDRALVIRVLEPIWKTKPETARRVRGRIEAVLDWATARDYRKGDNPARWKGSLQKALPAHVKSRSVRHFPALPYREMPAFFAKLQAEDGIGASALQFTILTAARTEEVQRIQWEEIDLEKAVWTVPAARMKSGREHRVPLSNPALALLRVAYSVTGGRDYAFPGRRPRKPISHSTMANTLKCLQPNGATVHGFRSTFRDWVEETTNFSGAVAEAALAHVVGDKVEARRGDLFEKRRKLMAAWATFCTTPGEGAKVIPIGRRARS